MIFKTKSPVPFIIVLVLVIVIGVIVFVATGGQDGTAHWEWTF